VADTMSAARAMWTMFEPVHDVTYFAPEALQAFTEAGLRGYWRGYFAGRAARNAVEAATDQAAERPWNRMGTAGLAEAADVLLPLAQACAAALPEVIPVGRLQPTRP
jgi:hypothetical protein